jgi:hypothetical protein
VPNGDEELEVEQQEFGSNDEQDNIGVVELNMILAIVTKGLSLFVTFVGM